MRGATTVTVSRSVDAALVWAIAGIAAADNANSSATGAAPVLKVVLAMIVTPVEAFQPFIAPFLVKGHRDTFPNDDPARRPAAKRQETAHVHRPRKQGMTSRSVDERPVCSGALRPR